MKQSRGRCNMLPRIGCNGESSLKPGVPEGMMRDKWAGITGQMTGKKCNIWQEVAMNQAVSLSPIFNNSNRLLCFYSSIYLYLAPLGRECSMGAILVTVCVDVHVSQTQLSGRLFNRTTFTFIVRWHLVHMANLDWIRPTRSATATNENSVPSKLWKRSNLLLPSLFCRLLPWLAAVW